MAGNSIPFFHLHLHPFTDNRINAERPTAITYQPSYSGKEFYS